jgi:hypothetical protein
MFSSVKLRCDHFEGTCGLWCILCCLSTRSLLSISARRCWSCSVCYERVGTYWMSHFFIMFTDIKTEIAASFWWHEDSSDGGVSQLENITSVSHDLKHHFRPNVAEDDTSVTNRHCFWIQACVNGKESHLREKSAGRSIKWFPDPLRSRRLFICNIIQS